VINDLEIDFLVEHAQGTCDACWYSVWSDIRQISTNSFNMRINSGHRSLQMLNSGSGEMQRVFGDVLSGSDYLISRENSSNPLQLKHLQRLGHNMHACNSYLSDFQIEILHLMCD
jgi:hypothetical protein